MKALIIILIILAVLFVLSLLIFFFNLDMKFAAKFTPVMEKHYDRAKEKRELKRS
jgi:hypothetical protein